MSPILQLAKVPQLSGPAPGGNGDRGPAPNGSPDRGPAGESRWAGPDATGAWSSGKPDDRGEPPALPPGLPAPAPCLTCGGGNFWLDTTPAAVLRCEVCQPIPAPVLVARRLFVFCDWPEGVGEARPPGYRWIDWGWVVEGQEVGRANVSKTQRRVR